MMVDETSAALFLFENLPAIIARCDATFQNPKGVARHELCIEIAQSRRIEIGKTGACMRESGPRKQATDGCGFVGRSWRARESGVG